MHQGTTFTAIDFGTATKAEAAYGLYVGAGKIDDDPARYAEAEALYRRAVALDPTLAIAFTNLGNVRFRRGDPSEAASLYRRALAIDDRQAEAHYNLGYLALNGGDTWRSILCFRRAIEADPCFADAHVHLAVAFERMGERRKARAHWKRYLEIEPNGAWAAAAARELADDLNPRTPRPAARSTPASESRSPPRRPSAASSSGP